MNESALLHAYRTVPTKDPILTLPCACGGLVHAHPMRPAKGVQAHNYTPRHKAWRAAREGS